MGGLDAETDNLLNALSGDIAGYWLYDTVDVFLPCCSVHNTVLYYFIIYISSHIDEPLDFAQT